MKTVFLDCNIFDKLGADESTRAFVADLIANGQIRVVATPIVVDELRDSPFGGVPDWFPVQIEPENVAVLGFARYGMARLGQGTVYNKHRGSSNKVKDGIIADSADALADVLVSEDSRCRNRLSALSGSCQAMTYQQFRAWLESLPSSRAV